MWEDGFMQWEVDIDDAWCVAGSWQYYSGSSPNSLWTQNFLYELFSRSVQLTAPNSNADKVTVLQSVCEQRDEWPNVGRFVYCVWWKRDTYIQDGVSVFKLFSNVPQSETTKLPSSLCYLLPGVFVCLRTRPAQEVPLVCSVIKAFVETDPWRTEGLSYEHSSVLGWAFPLRRL